MLATASSCATYFLSALSEGQAALAQEMLVLAVFALSFTLWRHFAYKRASTLKGSGGRKHVDDHSNGMHGWLPGDQTSKPRSVVRKFSDKDQVKAKTAEAEMLRRLTHCEFTRALNMYRGLERSGLEVLLSEELFAAFVQSAVRVGKIDVAERMLRAMKRSNITPSLQFWQHTMKLLSSRKQFSLCLSAYQLFERQVPSDKTVFSCLIHAALEMNLAERTPAMLEKFSQANIDTKDHVLHFRCFVALGDFVAAETLFKQLGERATTLMLNLLLLTCINKKEVERAFNLLQAAKNLDKVQGDGIVDIVSYNTVMKGFASAKSRLRCFDCMRDLIDFGLQPDGITLGALLDACIADNDLEVANEIGDLLISSRRHMNATMCTLFIKGLVRAGSLPKALALHEEMKRRDSSGPDRIAYSILIKGLVDQHDLDKALGLVDDMKKKGQSPDDIILTHLLEGCRHAGNCELGKKIFEEILATGLKPSDVTLVTMLKLYGRCGAYCEAYELVCTWESLHGTKPSVIHYTCLMSGCFRTKSYDQAWASFELMLANGVEPDSTTISTMVPGMIASRQWERVMILARKALQIGKSTSELPAEVLNHALSHMLAAGSPPQMTSELRMLMKRAGVRISARNATAAEGRL